MNKLPVFFLVAMMREPGSKVHRYKREQAHQDEAIDPIGQYRQRVLRAALRRALDWQGMRIAGKGGVIKDDFTRHLDAVLAVYLSSPKIKPYELEVFNAKYRDRLTDEVIAIKYGKKLKTVRNILYHVLGQIVARSDPKLIEALIDKPKRWILQGCSHCGGDLEWEDNGAHGDNGEYVCLLCARRYEFWGRGVIMPEGETPKLQG